MSGPAITTKQKPTLRIAIQEYSHATQNYNRGVKTYFVRLVRKSDIKAWIVKFETLLKGMMGAE